MTALILVDIQNDFLPDGALPVNEGDKIIPIVNELLKYKFDIIVASKDWHPKDHGSFASVHGKSPGEVIDLDGIKQILWSDHCVQESSGSDFASKLNTSKIDKVIYKGTEKNIDSYSAFFDNAHRKKTELDDYLKSKKITDLYLVGLATDVCVKYTALDATQLGYNTYVVKDGCRGIDLKEGDTERALKEVQDAGAKIIESKDLIGFIQ